MRPHLLHLSLIAILFSLLATAAHAAPPFAAVITITTPSPCSTNVNINAFVSAPFPADTDGDPVTYTASWQESTDDGATWPTVVDGPTVIALGTVALDKALTEPDRWYRLVVVASDDPDPDPDTSTTESTPVIINNPPTVPGVPVIGPLNPRTDDPLTINNFVPLSTDPDGDSLTYAVQWDYSADGVTWTPAGASTTFGHTSPITAQLSAGATMKGQWWRCRVRAYDGLDYSPGPGWNEQPDQDWSDSVQIVNVPATVDRVDITPASPVTADNLQATPYAIDLDGTTPAFEYQWFQSFTGAAPWTAIAGQTTATLPNAQTIPNRYYACDVRVRNDALPAVPGAVWSPYFRSPAVLIPNTAPSVPPTLPVISPATAYTDVALTFGNYNPGSTSEDPTDIITYNIQWGSRPNASAAWEDEPIITGLSAPINSTLNPAWQITPAQTTRGQQWRLRVQATDGTDTSDWAESTYREISNSRPVITSVPTISPTSPAPAASLEVQELTFTDLDPEDSVGTWRFQWEFKTTLSGTWTVSNSHTDAILPPNVGKKNEWWRCKVWVETGIPPVSSDPIPNVPTDDIYTQTVLFGDNPPTIADCNITTLNPTTETTLSCTASAVDIDGDARQYDFVWTSGTKSVTHRVVPAAPGATATDTLHKDNTVKGEIWTCTVTANTITPLGISTPLASNSVTILDSPPTFPTVGEISPKPAGRGATLSVINTDGDTDADRTDGSMAVEAPTYEYSWNVNGGTWDVTPRATVPSPLIRGDVWRVRARTVTNGLTSAWSHTSPTTGLDTVTIGDTPPNPPDVTVTPDVDLGTPGNQAYTSDNLVAEALAADEDGDLVTSYRYQWLQGTTDTGPWSAVAPAQTTATLAAAHTVVGRYYICRAWASTTTPAAEGLSGDSAPTLIINRPPTDPATPVISPATPRTTNTLTINYAPGSTDVDGDPITYNVLWAFSNNGGVDWTDRPLLTGLTSPVTSTVLPADTTKDQLWRVSIQATDGANTSGWVQSTSVTILNTVPTTPSPALTFAPLAPFTNEDFTASGTVNTTDADGDPVTLTLTWDYFEGAWLPFPGATQTGLDPSLPISSTIDKADTKRSQIWRYTIIASDDDGGNSTALTGQVTIADSPPTAPTTANITPDPADTDDTLSVTGTDGYTDLDTDDGFAETPTYEYSWRVNGGSWDTTPRATVPAPLTKGAVWEVRARTRTNGLAGPWSLDALDSITIGDGPPTAPTVTINPAPNANTTNDLTATAVATDPDDDALTYRYQWLESTDGGVTSNPIGGEVTSVLDDSFTTRGRSYACQAWATGDGEEGPVGTSAWTLIVNTVPTQPAQPVIAPASPLTADNLSINYNPGSTDDDPGDVVTYTVQWSYRAGNSGPFTVRPGLSVLTAPITDTIPAAETTKGQEWRVRVQADDETATSEWSDWSAVVTIGDTEPTVPSIPVISPATPVTADNLTTAGADSTDADGDAITYQYQWRTSPTADFTGVPWVDGTATLSNTLTSKGQWWQVQVCASSGSPSPLTSAYVESAPVEIGDTLPSVPTVTVAPAPNAYTLDDLVATPVATDADSATITYRYQWLESTDGGATSTPVGGNDATLENTLTTKGRSYACDAWATEGGVEQPTAGRSAWTLILNSAPNQPPVPTIEPTDPPANVNLTASFAGPLVDPDTDVLTYEFEWSKSTDDGVTWTPEVGTGANKETIEGSRTAKTQQWKALLKVTDNDATPLTVTRESAPVTIQDTAPEGTVTVVVTPADPATTNDLLATPSGGSDADGDALSYEVQWSFSDDDGATWSAWGNDGATLGAALTTKHQQWKAQARAVAGFPADWTGWFESNVVTVVNTPPTMPAAVAIEPASPDASTDLTATVTPATDVDPGDDALLTYLVQWSKSTDGGTTWTAWPDRDNPLPGDLVGLTLPLANLAKGDRWRARAAAFDGDDWGEWRTSPSVLIGNRAPSAPTAVGITPTTPTSTDALTAAASGGTDDDGDEVTYEYQWAVSTDAGLTWSDWGNPGVALPASATTRGEQWKARAYSSDGTVNSAAAFESDPVTIGDSAPTVPLAILVQPTQPRTGDDLIAAASGSTDPDSDPVTYAYQWSHRENSGALWSNWDVAGDTVPGSELVRGHEWKVRARAVANGLESADFESEAIVVVGNAPASQATAFSIAPAAPVTTDDLTVAPAGAVDPDGDPLTYQAQWSKSTDNGATWSSYGNNGLSLASKHTARGEMWKARARAYDGALYGPFRTCAPVTIGNSAPTDALEVSLEPGEGNLADSLVGSAAGATDADGDVVEYLFQWSRSSDGGVNWSNWSWDGGILPPNIVGTADMWRVRAKATDGLATSPAWLESAPLQLQVTMQRSWPQHNANNVCREGAITIAFYRDIMPATAEAAFSMQTTGGAPLVGTFTWPVAGRQMSFTPATALAVNTLYTVTLGPGIEYVAGGATAWSQSFSFTSGAEPVITSYTPQGENVALNAGVTIIFDQPMDRTSVRKYFKVTPTLSGRYVWFGNRQVTFDPVAAFAANSTYTVTVYRHCLSEDLTRTMRKSVRWTFTTGSDGLVPAMATATAQSTAQGAQITLNLTAAANVQVSICNIAGRMISALPAQDLPSGTTTLLWDGRSASGTKVPAGSYLVRVETRSPDGGTGHTITTLRR